MFDAIDGRRSIAEIVERAGGREHLSHARARFEGFIRSSGCTGAEPQRYTRR